MDLLCALVILLSLCQLLRKMEYFIAHMQITEFDIIDNQNTSTAYILMCWFTAEPVCD